MVMRALFVDFT